MPEPLAVARSVLKAGAWSGEADLLELSYEARFLRRKRVTAASGREVLVDLPDTVSLNDGDALVIDDGTRLRIAAMGEPMVEVRGQGLARLAWHIGNRHTPCEIRADRLMILRDPVLEKMLTGLGATLTPVIGPFRPEGGAYGHGRTLGHDHGGGSGHGGFAVHHHGSHIGGQSDDGDAVRE
jgi:urease accessory protein